MTDYELWKSRSDHRDFSPLFYTQIIVELEARIAELEAEVEEMRSVNRLSDNHVVKSLEAEVERLRATVIGLLGAEWMVTHDWGGDRESILRAARIEIGHDPDGGDDSGALAALATPPESRDAEGTVVLVPAKGPVAYPRFKSSPDGSWESLPPVPALPKETPE